MRVLRGGSIEELKEFIKEHPQVVKSRSFLTQAVQIAPTKLVSWIIATYVANGEVDINAADSNGNTPLHLAAMYGRQDVCMELLNDPLINDTIQNREGKQPVELSKYPGLAESMQISRARYVEKVAIKLRKEFEAENIPALEEVLSNPRAVALLDINGQDPDTGSTVLHEFVRKRNRKMVEFILSHGGDPFRRDVKGVLPIDLARGDDGMKKLLKSSMKAQNIISPPTLKVTSANPATAIEQIRNSASSSEAEQTGPRLVGDPPMMKGYLKKWTNFTGGYKLRWFVLENGVLSYYKRQNDTERACRGSISMRNASVHLDSSEKLRFEVITKGSNTKFHLKANHPVETSRWVWTLSNAIQYAKDLERMKTMTLESSASSIAPTTMSRSSSMSSRFISEKPLKKGSSNESDNDPALVIDKQLPAPDSGAGAAPGDNSDEEEYEEEDVDDSSLVDVSAHDQTAVLEDSVRIGLQAIRGVIVSLEENSETVSKEELQAGLEAIDQGVNHVEDAVKQYSKSVEARELYLNRRLDQAHTKEDLWAKNLESLQIEHEKIQGDLHRALQKRKEVYKLLKEAAAKEQKSQTAESGVTAGGLTPAIAQALSKGSVTDEEEDDDDEDDDEFFDAEDGSEAEAEEDIEAIRPAVVKSQLEKHDSNEKQPIPSEAEHDDDAATSAQISRKAQFEKEDPFAGYEDPPRTKLDLSADERPKVSLWGILKNLIGKDMTRMTLPVTFNECTSLIQRYCEDFEYPDLLDKAAKEINDPALRSVWIAAFALSSYSSTLHRVAKPFNPLLGETFEYARPDKGYRLFCEQVSHHPPIGAMYSEHPKWDYYGYSMVKPKFNGRAIDVIPSGCWYLVLRPDKGAQVEEEVYSFRKLTSTVVGIITGSPEVDNHGDLVVTNHTLGYKCVVKCKKQGWRGNNAYEVRGHAYNPEGVKEWDIGGHWDRKLVARKCVKGEGDKLDSVVADTADKKIVLWQVKDRAPSPFNLTEFAISLNALPERLKGWLAPTDTRFRPDQRAMELGQFDKAFKEKDRVEEKQREAKKSRDAKNEEWAPRWFEKAIHPDTKEEYYRWTNKYWQKRHQHELADSGDIF